MALAGAFGLKVDFEACFNRPKLLKEKGALRWGRERMKKRTCAEARRDAFP